jgi:dTDP-4-dehydrorhamnose reductase
MHLALIGGRGLLGCDLRDAAGARGWSVAVLDLPEFDITKPDRIAERLPAVDAAINCAAFTRVDDAEREREACRAINADGAGYLARACAERGIYLIHLSTDYVFAGDKGTPYTEGDVPAPLNFYGLTKLEGERRVQASGAMALIVRTQSLYGLRGRNFVRAILAQIRNGRDELSVVSDQISAPTYTRHLADALLDLAAARPAAGIVNAAASGACSWWAFARAIVARTRPGVRVLEKTSSEMNFPARRPAYSVLDTTKLKRLIGRALPPWEEGLDAYLAEEPLAAEVRAMR